MTPKAGVAAAPKAPPLCARPKAGVLAGVPKPNPPEAAAGWPNAGVVAAPKAADACVCARELSGSTLTPLRGYLVVGVPNAADACNSC